MICGNCKCYTAFQFHAETGRCRKYNVTVQLRTECLEREHYICVCSFKECMDRNVEDERLLREEWGECFE